MKNFSKSQFIAQLSAKKLDKHRTSFFLADFACADVFGGTHFATTPEGLLSNLKKLGANVDGWLYEEPYWVKVAELSKVEVATVKVDIVKELEETTSDIEEIAEIKNEPSKEQPDWEWVENLSNTSPSKKELEKYARGWNVELKRNKSLENMILDFKKALED